MKSEEIRQLNKYLSKYKDLSLENYCSEDKLISDQKEKVELKNKLNLLHHLLQYPFDLHRP